MNSLFLNKHLVCFGLLLLTISNIHSQTTFSWNGTYGGSNTNRTYSLAPIGGITMSATIVNSENMFQDASPRFFATGSSNDPGCSGIPSVNQGLLLSTNWTSNTTKTITTTITFSHAVGAVRFKLYDINDDGFGSWQDRIVITATNNAGTAVNIYNEGTACVSTGGSVSGNGTATLTYASGSSGACTCYGNNSVRVGNDAGGCTQIKTITIQYRSTNTSYDNPKQYVVISDLITNCAPLPIELISFTGEVEHPFNLLKWETASERNNSHFIVERSTDGIEWQQFSTVLGAGNTTQMQSYKTHDTEFENTTNYYRLTQVDYDGTEKSSNIISIDNSVRNKTLDKIINLMGQTVGETYKGLKIYIYTDGTIIRKND